MSLLTATTYSLPGRLTADGATSTHTQFGCIPSSIVLLCTLTTSHDLRESQSWIKRGAGGRFVQEFCSIFRPVYFRLHRFWHQNYIAAFKTLQIDILSIDLLPFQSSCTKIDSPNDVATAHNIPRVVAEKFKASDKVMAPGKLVYCERVPATTSLPC